MITGSNSDVITKQLEEYSKEVERRLKHMVQRFAVDIVRAASANTPLGNAELFIEWYEQRKIDTGLDAIEGVAQGAWMTSFDGHVYFTINYGESSDEVAIANAGNNMQGYVLGSDFIIGNEAPYIGALEGGYSKQAPDGIMQPTLDQIKAAHEADLKRYYDAG